MAQIKVLIGPKVEDIFTKLWLDNLAGYLTRTVEKEFGLEGLNDVAFTAMPALYTKGEADVQIEIRYTAGKDEYNKGKPFNPSERKQMILVKKIKSAFDEFCENYKICKECKMPPVSLSVWCIPYYNTVFKVWEN